MKALFVFNHPAPYKVKCFNLIAKQIDIDVIFERRKAKDRPNTFYQDNVYGFNHFFIDKGLFGKENCFSGALRKYIKEHHKEYDVIVMNGYSTIAEQKAIRYMNKHHIPFVLQINGGIIKKDFYIKKKIKQYFISSASSYLSPGPLADNYIIHYGGDKNKIHFYPYSNFLEKDIIEKPLTDEEKSFLRKQYDLPEGRLFVCPTQFIERKNNIQLIKIFAKTNAKLLLIGDGPLKNDYMNLINEGHINNVFLLPYQPKEQLFTILKACDFFVTLSKEDIFGHTTLEAMANGLPVLSSNKVISSMQLIKNGINGYILDINNEEDIIQKINVIDSSLAVNALQTARKNTIEASANKIIEGIK